jgi:hypothetical protein
LAFANSSLRSAARTGTYRSGTRGFKQQVGFAADDHFIDPFIDHDDGHVIGYFH